MNNRFGTFMNNVGSGKGLGKFGSQFSSLDGGLQQGISSLASGVGGMIGKGISNGLSSSAGNVIGELGNVAAAIPGPWGAIASAGLKVVGGLTDAAFGSKLNQENINEVNNNIAQMRNFNSNAGSFDALSEAMASQPVSMGFKDSFIGKDGWFSNKAKNKANNLREEQAVAQNWVNSSLANNLQNLQNEQMGSLLANYGALGGPLHAYGADWNNGLIDIDEGGTHEQNPYDGVLMGVDEEGVPNLVEEGEVVWNDYVFSNRMQVPDEVKHSIGINGSSSISFASAVKKLQKASKERPFDPIEKRGLDRNLARLMDAQEYLRAQQQLKQQQKALKAAYGGFLGHKFAKGGKLGKKFEGFGDEPNLLTFPSLGGKTYTMPSLNPGTTLAGLDNEVLSKAYKTAYPTAYSYATGLPITSTVTAASTPNKRNYLTYLRYAPILGAGSMAFSDLMGWTNKPDYSNANLIMSAANSARDVKYTPLGDYLTYRPFDRMNYINQLNANAGATRRAISNNSGLNRGQAIAGLLAADQQALNQIGELGVKAEAYNQGLREKVATFNRGTNQYNSETDLKAQIANNSNRELAYSGAVRAAGLRDAANARADAARSVNLTNFLDNLGNLGREEVMHSWVNNNPGFRYAVGLDGRGVYFKPVTAANGGYLTINKNKRGRRR